MSTWWVFVTQGGALSGSFDVIAEREKDRRGKSTGAAALAVPSAVVVSASYTFDATTTMAARNAHGVAAGEVAAVLSQLQLHVDEVCATGRAWGTAVVGGRFQQRRSYFSRKTEETWPDTTLTTCRLYAGKKKKGPRGHASAYQLREFGNVCMFDVLAYTARNRASSRLTLSLSLYF